jgi:dihydroorotase
MNAGMKDLLTTGDKFLAMGLPLKEVIADMTWHPAREIQQMQLGNLSEGSIADVTVLSMNHGNFGLVDGGGLVMKAHEKLVAELTIKDGKFVYDLNGRSSDPWNQPSSAAVKQANKWTSLRMSGFGDARRLMASTTTNTRQSRPAKWQPYTTNSNGTAIVKQEAKIAATATSRAVPKKVPPPAVTWKAPPSDAWPAAQR